jgi:hypothetical protein
MSTSTDPRPIRLAAALAGLALAIVVFLSPAQAPGAEARPVAKAAKKRAHYPPARLWYRLRLDFDGSLSGELAADEGTLDYEMHEGWQLRSNTAVRVSLMCVNRRVPVDPFFARERIRRHGRRRRVTVGGCGHRVSKNLIPTLRFQAAARGEATDWSAEDHMHRFGCEPWSKQQTMVEPQPIDGLLSSASSATEGLRYSSDASAAPQASATIDVFEESTTCVAEDGSRYTTDGNEGTRRFSWQGDHLGSESVIDRRPTAESMRFRPDPRRFGRRIKMRFGPLTQDYDISRPFDNGAGLMHYAAKDYSYRLTLVPCPRHGRDVGSC